MMSKTPSEWIGGYLSPPFFITDRETPYRPALAVWLELPSGLVVAHDLAPPEATAGCLGRGLLAALENPHAGAPRTPEAIRVATDELAAEVRSVAASIPVAVAPTPELDELRDSMVESMSAGDQEPSYLENGRIAPECVEELFVAASVLFRLAPWRTANDGQILRMDIPSLDVNGACVSIIGSLDESRGVLIFPSLAGYEAFALAADSEGFRDGPSDAGTSWLALTFEDEDEFPDAMYDEIAEHDWPVVAEDAYPLVEHRERDASPRPLVERDVRIAAACATSLSAFFVKHGHLFRKSRFEPVCESYFDGDDREVRFTIPYEAFELFDIDEEVPRPRRTSRKVERKVGRNDPCPCGSGRKYKRCHLREDDLARVSDPETYAGHDLDARMVAELVGYAESRLEPDWSEYVKDFHAADESVSLSVPWSVYHYLVRGASVLDWYVEERGEALSAAERGWLDAQSSAWLSIWEVLEVEKDDALTLRDLLTHETRRVREKSATEMLVRRDALLARVVDHGGVSWLCGVHPRVLPPRDAAEVVRLARGRLRRKRAVPIERLRDEKLGRYLIRRWEDAVDAHDARHDAPADIRNSDGDPLLLTVDHFSVTGGRGELEKHIAAEADVEGPDRVGDETIFTFVGRLDSAPPGLERPVVGVVRVTSGKLRLETNSIRRADRLRARLEKRCGDRIRHKAREHADPTSQKLVPSEAPPAPEQPELAEAIASFQSRYYEAWLDEPIPALGGETPRRAVRTAEGRTKVDELIKEMENLEARRPAEIAFDFGGLRRELKLD